MLRAAARSPTAATDSWRRSADWCCAAAHYGPCLRSRSRADSVCPSIVGRRSAGPGSRDLAFGVLGPSALEGDRGHHGVAAAVVAEPAQERRKLVMSDERVRVAFIIRLCVQGGLCARTLELSRCKGWHVPVLPGSPIKSISYEISAAVFMSHMSRHILLCFQALESVASNRTQHDATRKTARC